MLGLKLAKPTDISNPGGAAWCMAAYFFFELSDNMLILMLMTPVGFSIQVIDGIK
ncbi:MAG: hypothetical protein O7C70_03460 [Candidatus Dadabacteria bacterium]|nr:hypothetical protein [Candidatus Dadabacteria bacterium]